jgi:tRNA (guanine-N7-)-methyltransferase
VREELNQAEAKNEVFENRTASVCQNTCGTEAQKTSFCSPASFNSSYPSAARRDRFFGRRLGRPLTQLKRDLMADLLPRLQITLEDKLLDPRGFFQPQTQSLWLEIGFGHGEHCAQLAQDNPTIGFIGAEAFSNGVAALLATIQRMALSNIRLFHGDASALLPALPDACLDRIYLLFSDPWPKKRHADRRFLQPETCRQFVRLLRHGGLLRLATDDPVLQIWLQQQLTAPPELEAEFGSGISPTPPPDWHKTRYETKALAAGRQPLYYCFARR